MSLGINQKLKYLSLEFVEEKCVFSCYISKEIYAAVRFYQIHVSYILSDRRKRLLSLSLFLISSKFLTKEIDTQDSSLSGAGRNSFT